MYLFYILFILFIYICNFIIFAYYAILQLYYFILRNNVCRPNRRILSSKLISYGYVISLLLLL